MSNGRRRDTAVAPSETVDAACRRALDASLDSGDVENGPMQWSQTWTWFDGGWHEGNPGIVGPRTHAFWLGSSVFDGARAFEGVTPDLDLHLARVNRSAVALGLQPTKSEEEMLALAAEGIARFGANAELYIRPMYWAEAGGASAVMADPASTRFCLCIHEAPMPKPAGSAITLSPFPRPTPETAPLEAKAGCLYPNNSRAMMEAKSRGFDNCLLRDMLGHIAELGNSNIFMAKDGVVYTPAANGTFLSGITRQRVIELLRGDGVTVLETSLSYRDFETADEIFASGNFAKVQPIIRIDDRSLQPGPFYAKARKLYWEFAHG
jgi:branched-chain amino acid aminotransferase